MQTKKEEINYPEILAQRPNDLDQVIEGNSLRQVLKSIWCFCFWSYWHNQNPLPALKKLYPQFVWQYVEYEAGDVAKVIEEYPSYVFSNFWDEKRSGLVLARLKFIAFWNRAFVVMDKRCDGTGDWTPSGFTEIVDDFLGK